MDLKEVNDLSINDERKHWWINTRFNYIDRAIAANPSDKINVLEFGCGTGQNLWYLRSKSHNSKKIEKMLGIDPELSSEARFDWNSDQDKVSNSLDDKLDGANVLLAMDVLEHIDDDYAALKAWVDKIESGSTILLTVPAFKVLWSYHDVFLDHKRRYTKSELTKLAVESGLEPIKVSYAFSYLFPVVYLVRKLMPNNDKEIKSDLNLPNPLVNAILKVVGKVESWLGGCPWFGTSVIGIFRKP